jgi:hypothetical protein
VVCRLWIASTSYVGSTRFNEKGQRNTTALSHRNGVAPDIQNSEVHVRQFRFNSADFLKLGVSNVFVIDETNRNLR